MTSKIIRLATIGAIVALTVSVPALASPTPRASHRVPTGSTSHVARDVVIGLVGVLAVTLVAMGATVPSRRHRFVPA